MTRNAFRTGVLSLLIALTQSACGPRPQDPEPVICIFPQGRIVERQICTSPDGAAGLTFEVYKYWYGEQENDDLELSQVITISRWENAAVEWYVDSKAGPAPSGSRIFEGASASYVEGSGVVARDWRLEIPDDPSQMAHITRTADGVEASVTLLCTPQALEAQ